MLSGTIVLVIAAAAIIYFFLWEPKWNNLPPGPKGIPLLGNLLQLEKFQYKSFAKWAKEYGPIFKVDFATNRAVIVSDYKLLKEIFSESNFSGRQNLVLFDFVTGDKHHGVIHTEGEDWEQLRRFTLRQLRDFGFGKNTMEESIMLEVNELMDILKSRQDKPVKDMKEKLLLAVVNSVWAIVTGERHKQTDKALIQMTTKANKVFNEMLKGGAILMFAPWVAKIFPGLSGYNRLRQQMDGFTESYRKSIALHLASYEEGHQRDFIDTFIQEIKKTTDPTSPFLGKTGENNLLGILSDLYFAGSDTTSTTLSWMILYLSKMTDIQKKLQEEIEKVTGNTRPCSVADRPNMPYTEAVIAETHRFASIVSQVLPHKAHQDQEFKGYMIPKDTLIIPNFRYIHSDPAIWGDPENFRPERFLSPDGKTFKKHDALIPFSVGRRQCLGETLARDSLFLFSTNLFQRFDIQFDKDGPDNGFDPELAFILTPLLYSILIKDRLE